MVGAGGLTRPSAVVECETGGVITVLYDADCGFCTRSARWLERRGAAVVITPLQANDLTVLRVDAERAVRELPVVLESGEVVYGATAIREALAAGPWWMRAVSVAMRFPPLAALAGVVYRWVAANRHRLPGGTASCSLDERPDQSGGHR